MKLVWLAAVAALASSSTPADAEKWVEYGISGSGYYDSIEGAGFPLIWKSGQAQLRALFYVEVDPSDEGEWRYYSDGRVFSQLKITDYYSAISENGTLSFSHYILDANCGHDHCETWQIDLQFAPGSFDTFPEKVPHLISGQMDFYSLDYGFSFHAYGDVFRVTSQVVDRPGDSGFWVQPVPEPASWAMMLSGFGLVGGAMRARRKTAVSFG